jgi:YD repeat-containing protein
LSDDPARVDWTELEFSDDLLAWHGDDLFDGVALDHDPVTGRLVTEVAFRDGMEHGPRRAYDEQGRLVSETVMERGNRRSGRVWDSAGRLREEFTFGPTGDVETRRQFAEDGSVLEAAHDR